MLNLEASIVMRPLLKVERVEELSCRSRGERGSFISDQTPKHAKNCLQFHCGIAKGPIISTESADLDHYTNQTRTHQCDFGSKRVRDRKKTFTGHIWMKQGNGYVSYFHFFQTYQYCLVDSASWNVNPNEVPEKLEII